MHHTARLEHMLDDGSHLSSTHRGVTWSPNNNNTPRGRGGTVPLLGDPWEAGAGGRLTLATPLPVPTGGFCAAYWMRTSAPSVNRRLRFVFMSWDLDVPHQIHPQNPIHTSLAQLSTV